MYAKFLQLHNKTKTSINEGRKDLNSHFTKEDTQMVNKP